MTDRGHRDEQGGRGDRVAAGQRNPPVRGPLDETVDQLFGKADRTCRRQAERHVGLTGVGSHRGQVRKGGGQRLVSDQPRSGEGTVEVDPFDDCVDGNGRLAVVAGDRGVIADAGDQRTARRRLPPEAVDQLEFSGSVHHRSLTL